MSPIPIALPLVKRNIKNNGIDAANIPSMCSHHNKPGIKKDITPSAAIQTDTPSGISSDLISKNEATINTLIRHHAISVFTHTP